MAVPEVSVLIKGTDTATPAFKEAAAAGKAFGQTLEATSRDVVTLQGRLTSLRMEHQLGRISSHEYSASLREVRADAQSLANQANITAQAEAQLARVAASATAAAGSGRGGLREAMRMDSLVMGLGGLAEAGAGAEGALHKVSSALMFLTMGNPELFALLAGISLVVAGFEAITKASGEAADKAGGFSEQLRFVRAVGLRSGEQRLADLQAQARRQAPTTRIDQFGETLTSGGGAELATTQQQIEDLTFALGIARNDAARARNAKGPSKRLEELLAQREFEATMENNLLDAIARDPSLMGRIGAQLRGQQSRDMRDQLNRGFPGHEVGHLTTSDTDRQLFGSAEKTTDSVARGMERSASSARSISDLVGGLSTLQNVLHGVGGAAEAGFGALVRGAEGGKLGVSAVLKAITGEITKEAEVSALREFAKGFSLAIDPLTAPLAPSHFLAAAKWTAVAGFASSIGGGGGGGGSSSGGAGSPNTSVPSSSGQSQGQPTQTIIRLVIVGTDGKDMTNQVIYDTGRQQALGYSPPGQMSSETVRVPGIIVRVS